MDRYVPAVRRVVTFPHDDCALEQRVREIVASPDMRDLAEVIEGRLRAVYPSLTVHASSPMAGFGLDRVLYVFRDGRAVSDPTVDDWVTHERTARVVTDAAGTYLEANEAAALLFGVSRDEIIGRPAGSFTRPDARVQDAASLWRRLAETGRMHSFAVVVAPD